MSKMEKSSLKIGSAALLTQVAVLVFLALFAKEELARAVTVKSELVNKTVTILEVPKKASPMTCEAVDGLPDSKCTPGSTNPAVTQETIKKTICVSGWTKTIRPPSSFTGRVKVAQLKLYGDSYHDKVPSHFEEDHFLPLTVGGNPTDSKNLFPQLWHLNVNGYDAGAYTKDRIEVLINKKICKEEITLQQGQEMLLEDWIATYRKYIGQLPKF